MVRCAYPPTRTRTTFRKASPFFFSILVPILALIIISSHNATFPVIISANLSVCLWTLSGASLSITSSETFVNLNKMLSFLVFALRLVRKFSERGALLFGVSLFVCFLLDNDLGRDVTSILNE